MPFFTHYVRCIYNVHVVYLYIVTHSLYLNTETAIHAISACHLSHSCNLRGGHSPSWLGFFFKSIHSHSNAYRHLYRCMHFQTPADSKWMTGWSRLLQPSMGRILSNARCKTSDCILRKREKKCQPPPSFESWYIEIKKIPNSKPSCPQT